MPMNEWSTQLASCGEVVRFPAVSSGDLRHWSARPTELTSGVYTPGVRSIIMPRRSHEKKHETEMTRSGMRPELGLSLALLVAVALLFCPVLAHPFSAYDDQEHVVTNPYLNPPNAARIAYFWRVPWDKTPAPGITPPPAGVTPPYLEIYAPLAFTAWGGLAFLARELPTAPGQLGALDPNVFHSANLLLHCVNTILVFLLLRRLTRENWGSALGALFFAIHPAQVETVAWVTAMNNLLSTTFALVAALCFLRPEGSSGPTVVTDLGALLLFALSILAKPSLLPLPFILFLLETAHCPSSWKRTVLRLVPMLVVAFLDVVLVHMVTEGRSGVEPLVGLQRFWVEGGALAIYLWHLVVPLNLVPDYGLKPAILLQDHRTHFTWIVPAALLLAPVILINAKRWLTREARLAWAGVAVFLIVLIPTSGVVDFYFHQVSVVADRYMYGAMLGPALLIALGIGALNHRQGGEVEAPQSGDAFAAKPPVPAVLALSGLIAVGLMLLTARQVSLWKDDESLWSHNLELNPRSAGALNILAFGAARKKEWDKAERYTTLALQIAPDDWRFLQLRAKLYRLGGQPALAITYYQRALARNPSLLAAQLGLGQSYLQTGQLVLAEQQLEAALQQNSGLPEPWIGLGEVYAREGRWDQAFDSAREAASRGFLVNDGDLQTAQQQARTGNKAGALSHYLDALNGGLSHGGSGE